MLQDGQTLISVSQGNSIHIWHIGMQVELGQVRDHVGLKNASIEDIKEFRYADEYADEMDIDQDSQTLYDDDERDQRIISIGADAKLRIFNLKTMSLERTIEVSVEYYPY